MATMTKQDVEKLIKILNMATMTKQDVEKLIKDVAGEVLGEQINELRKELEGTADQRMAEWMKEQAKAKEEEKKTEKGIGAARFVRALAAAKGDIDRAVNVAKKWNDERLVKALSESTLEDGGALVPEEYRIQPGDYRTAPR